MLRHVSCENWCQHSISLHDDDVDDDHRYGDGQTLAVGLTKDLAVPMERTDCCWNLLAADKAARDVLVDNIMMLLNGCNEKQRSLY